MSRVSRSRSALVERREVQRRDAGEQDGDEIAAPGRRRVVENRVQRILEAGELGGRVAVGEAGCRPRGSIAFQRSFFPSGMTTSLTSGFRAATPARSGPFVSNVPSPRRILHLRAAGASPRRRSTAFGVRRLAAGRVVRHLDRDRVHVVAATPSLPSSAASGIRCAMLNGRSPPRSKIDPRSTKNGSSRWPANTCVAGRGAGRRACERVVVGVERGPMFTRRDRQRPPSPTLPSCAGPSTRVTRVGLPDVKIGVERGDRPGVVEERVRVRAARSGTGTGT